jgi:hypothetical protein
MPYGDQTTWRRISGKSLLEYLQIVPEEENEQECDGY